jgi:hypothetical protein
MRGDKERENEKGTKSSHQAEEIVRENNKEKKEL